MRWSGDGAGTWIMHAVVAVLGPLVVLPFERAPRAVALLSLAVLALFVARERAQTARKRREGTWTPQWQRDRVGDLLGPATATACYLSVWGLL